MRAVRLFAKLTLYYVCAFGLLFAGVTAIPSLRDFIPFGGAEALLSGPGGDPFEPIEIGRDEVAGLRESVVWLVIAEASALLCILPCAWVYMALRKRDEYDQSLVETIIILPLAVTGIVIIVHDSLALAFSLAGIVGGVRFRNTLKSSGDALYILLAIGVGLSAGIGAMEIALVMSIAFNYCFLVLWITDFGARKGTHRYMRHIQDHRGDAP